MKSILVPYHEEEAARAALKFAVALAKQHGSYVEGMMVRGEPALGFVRGMITPPDYARAAAEGWKALVDQTRAEFIEVTEAGGLPLKCIEERGEGPGAGWCERQGEEAAIVGERGRAFDLIVFGRPEGTASRRWREVREAALFQTGRPVVLAPLSWKPAPVGRKIAIAWNGSTETARTIAFGMPFLLAADSVLILTVEGHSYAGPTGEEMTTYLTRNGIDVTYRKLTPNGIPAGETILDAAGNFGADVIFKGAFSRSRFREVVFGGTTQHILDYAKIPVFLAH